MCIYFGMARSDEEYAFNKAFKVWYFYMAKHDSLKIRREDKLLSVFFMQAAELLLKNGFIKQEEKRKFDEHIRKLTAGGEHE